MAQPAATPVSDPCTTARKQMTIRVNYPKDGFIEINNAVSENLLNALSKLNQTQEMLDKKIKQLMIALETTTQM